jgi:hypothetical protein
MLPRGLLRDGTCILVPKPKQLTMRRGCKSPCILDRDTEDGLSASHYRYLTKQRNGRPLESNLGGSDRRVRGGLPLPEMESCHPHHSDVTQCAILHYLCFLICLFIGASSTDYYMASNGQAKLMNATKTHDGQYKGSKSIAGHDEKYTCQLILYRNIATDISSWSPFLHHTTIFQAQE